MLNALDRFASALGWWLIDWSITGIVFLALYWFFELRGKDVSEY